MCVYACVCGASTSLSAHTQKPALEPISAQYSSACRTAMAEAMKLSRNHAPPSDSSKMSSYTDCMDSLLQLLADFGEEVCLDCLSCLVSDIAPFSPGC